MVKQQTAIDDIKVRDPLSDWLNITSCRTKMVQSKTTQFDAILVRLFTLNQLKSSYAMASTAYNQILRCSLNILLLWQMSSEKAVYKLLDSRLFFNFIDPWQWICCMPLGIKYPVPCLSTETEGNNISLLCIICRKFDLLYYNHFIRNLDADEIYDISYFNRLYVWQG